MVATTTLAVTNTSGWFSINQLAPWAKAMDQIRAQPPISRQPVEMVEVDEQHCGLLQAHARQRLPVDFDLAIDLGDVHPL